MLATFLRTPLELDRFDIVGLDAIFMAERPAEKRRFDLPIFLRLTVLG